MALILDIETYKTSDEALVAYKVASKKREDYKQTALEKLALYPNTGRIIVVGLLSNSQLCSESILWNLIPYPEGEDATEQNVLFQSILDGEEKDIIDLTWKAILKEIDNGGQIVTYNGKKFDIPYLIRRGMALGVTPPHRREGVIFYPYDLIKKYDSGTHLDLGEKLNPNYGDYVSLSEWAHVMGISQDLGSEGKNVAEWFEKGEFDRIKEHCSEDLWKTFYLYERVKLWLS